MSEPFADSARMLEAVSAWISDSSLATLRRRLEAIMAGLDPVFGGRRNKFEEKSKSFGNL
jgi:hypothetical protein